jgi:general secretion pathway protein K
MNRAVSLHLPDTERGATLVAVLLIIAVMATTAILISETMVRTTQQAVTAAARDQARWYGRAAEGYATRLIAEELGKDARFGPLIENGGYLFAAFPVEAGEVSMTLRDGTNCFNLNSLSLEGPFADGVLSPRDEFAGLMSFLGVPTVEAEALAGAAKDWIDADPSPEPGGAEHAAYAFSRPPYRTAGFDMASVSELRAVQGFSADLVRALTPLVCARSAAAPSLLNVNTLTLADAGLLFALTNGVIDAQRHERFVEGRPVGGYATLEEAFASPASDRIELKDTWKGRFTVSPTRFVLSTDIDVDGQGFGLISIIEPYQGRLVRTSREAGE